MTSKPESCLEAFEARFCDDVDPEDVPHTIRWYERLLGPYLRKRPAAVLDIGCGPGRGVLAMANLSPTTRFVGVDGSSRILRRAAKELHRCRHRVELRREDLTKEGFARLLAARCGQFDLITSLFVLHAYPVAQISRILCELRDHLLTASGTIVLAECNNPKDPRAAFADRAAIELADMAGREPDLLLSPETLRPACRAAGFPARAIRQVPRSGWPFSPEEAAFNRRWVKITRLAVRAIVAQHAESGIEPSPDLARFARFLTEMSRHRAGLPTRIGPILFELRHSA